MTPRLSPVLSRLDLPYPEMQAARLDGELVEVDECFASIDQHQHQLLRAQALLTLAPRRLIAEQRSAAWIMGLTSRPPAIHQLCVSSTARVRAPSSPRMAVREVVISDEELMSVGGLQVTIPMRTAIDIARFSSDFGDAEARLIAALMDIGGFTALDCRAEMDQRTNLPGKNAAIQRLLQVATATTADSWGVTYELTR
jgi:hypothetical protein